MNEVVTRFVDLPADTKIALISFLKADHIPVLYFNNASSGSTGGDEGDRNRSKDSSTKSMSRKLIKQMSQLSGRTTTHTSEDVILGKKKKPLVILVSRNSTKGGVKFDVSAVLLCFFACLCTQQHRRMRCVIVMQHTWQHTVCSPQQ
jgi:hypothetical protein